MQIGTYQITRGMLIMIGAIVVIVFLLASVFFGILPGSRPAGQTPVTLEFWGLYDDLSVWQEIFNDFKKENLLSEIKFASNVVNTQYDTLHFTNSELNNLRNQIVKTFYVKKIISYVNPSVFYKDFLSKIKSFEDARYILKSIYMLTLNF